MRIFDYIYFRIASLYLNTFKDKNGLALGALFVSLLQIFILGLLMNMTAILSQDFNSFVFDRFLNDDNYKIWKLFIAIFILGSNFYRYFSIINYEQLLNRWSYEDSVTKRNRGVNMTWFTIILFISVIGLALVRQIIYK